MHGIVFVVHAHYGLPDLSTRRGHRRKVYLPICPYFFYLACKKAGTDVPKQAARTPQQHRQALLLWSLGQQALQCRAEELSSQPAL